MPALLSLIFIGFIGISFSFSIKFHELSRKRFFAGSKRSHSKLAVSNEYSISFSVPKDVYDVYQTISSSPIKLNNYIGSMLSSVKNGEDSISSDLLHSVITVTSMVDSNPLFYVALGIMVSSSVFFLLPNILKSSKVASNPSFPYDIQSNVAVYNPSTSEDYYRSRPWLIIGRLLKLLTLTSSFNVNLLLDWRFGNLEKNMKSRAEEALGVIGQMGPTFVKLGQALSIRTDLIPDIYAVELRKLQDSVPPFDSTLAKSIICNELGISKFSEKFKVFPEQPIAAASIGQVYKAQLLDGRDVAVKVQRPDILAEISLDLYLLRVLAPLQVKLVNILQGSKAEEDDVDIAYSLVDEWGKGLVAEVDYRLEAKNTMQFIEAMSKRGLNAVTSPGVIEELSRAKVLVTEWIAGTRLDRDASSDVPRLCGLAVNAYLTMLLDTGVLHCDPHPGNLLRTTDGRLCILDWGMTLTLPKDLQYGLLEFISHLNAEDFDKLPDDFVKLGATPPDKLEEVRKSGIANGFALIMKQLGKGGGPTKVTEGLRSEFKARYGDLSDSELNRLANEEMNSRRELMMSSPMDSDTASIDVSGAAGMMEMMSKKNREIFQLPSYMLYVVRAFSVLEGIGLSINPSYSILQECYPYLAKRLMTDDSPRSRAALRNMIYRDGKLKTDKLLEFSEGFTSYTASTVDVDEGGEGLKQAQEALAELILDSKGNLMQDLLLEGAAKFADSIVRVGLDRIRLSPGGQLAEITLKTPKTIVDAIVPSQLRPLMLPFTLPYDLAKAVVKLTEKDESDQENVQALKSLIKGMEPAIKQRLKDLTSNGADSPVISRDDILIPLTLVESNSLKEILGKAKPIERIPVFLRLTRKFGATMFNQAAQRMDSATSRTNTHSSSHDLKGLREDEIQEDFDYEVEVLLTGGLGSVSSATAKRLSRVLDVGGRRN